MSDEPKIPTLVRVQKGLFANTDYTPPTDLDTHDLKEIARDLLRKGRIHLADKPKRD